MSDALTRSNRADVRNPLLKHPGIVAEWARLKEDHPPAAVALCNMLKFTAQVCGDEGDKHWGRRKYTSGQYWKVQGVYARHLRNAAALSVPAPQGPGNDDAREAALWRAHAPQWAAALNRRATVEQWMFDAANGKRPLPDALELRQWALKLGTPGDSDLQGAACAQAGTGPLRDATAREVNDALARYVAAGAAAPPPEASEPPTPGEALRDPAASRWFRSSLASAMERDPVDAANDAEVLYRVLDRQAQRALVAARTSLDLRAGGAGPAARGLPLLPGASEEGAASAPPCFLEDSR